MDAHLVLQRDAEEHLRSAFLLERLAEYVGCPASAFSTGRIGIARIDQGLEMNRLWGAIQSDEGRRQVLEFMRHVARRGALS